MEDKRIKEVKIKRRFIELLENDKDFREEIAWNLAMDIMEEIRKIENGEAR